MDLSEIDFSSSQRHPWEVFRAKFIIKLISSKSMLTDESKIVNVLDFGAGDGYLSKQILEEFKSIQTLDLVDLNFVSLETNFENIKRYRNIPNNKKYDLILACDVLEHIENPSEIVADLVSILNDGGLMVLTVPAYRLLFSKHDLNLGHFDRYTKKRLNEVVKKYHLKLAEYGYFFPISTFFAFFRKVYSSDSKKLNQRKSEAEFFIVNLVFYVDFKISLFLRSINLNNLGLSCYGVYRK